MGWEVEKNANVHVCIFFCRSGGILPPRPHTTTDGRTMPAQSRLTFKISVLCPTADVNKKPSPNSSAAKREAQHIINSVMKGLPAKTANPRRLRTSYTVSLDRRQKTKMTALFAPNPESYGSQQNEFRNTRPLPTFHVVRGRAFSRKSLYSQSPGKSNAWTSARHTPC